MAFGFGIGALLGGLGSGIEAADARRQQTRFRRRQRRAIQSARNFAGGTTVTTGEGMFGDRGPAFAPGTVITEDMLEAGLPRGTATFIDPTTGERRAGGRVDEILADPLLMQARSFLEGTFGNAADSPLAQDFVKGIRAAQAARGTGFGGAAINTEAGGLAAFSQRLRQDLLPQALAFGTLGENLRQSVLGFEAPLRTAAATGGGGLGDSSGLVGPGILSSILRGATSGGAAGFSLDREFGLSGSIQNLLSPRTSVPLGVDPLFEAQLLRAQGGF